MTALAPTLESFFVERLINQKDASPRTIATYRDTLRLLLRYASERTGKQPSKLDITDLDAPLISAFLDHLEHERGNTARTRNARLAAIHSLYRFAALRHPEHAHTIARVIEPPNATPVRCSATSIGRRSRRCSPPQIAPPGSDAETTRSCSP